LLFTSSLVASLASATHTIVTPNESTFASIGPYNGKIVYLSSPRHTSSGSRGELGWEENINGRHWNYYATTGNFKNGTLTQSITRNLRARGYKVILSPNSRDGLIKESIRSSNKAGADVHITTHTNAGRGNYMLVMVDNNTATTYDRLLQSRIGQFVGVAVPGTEVFTTDGTGYTNGIELAELDVNAKYTVYVELIFHDNQAHVDWFGSGTDWGASVKHDAWRYGMAVDIALGYP